MKVDLQKTEVVHDSSVGVEKTAFLSPYFLPDLAIGHLLLFPLGSPDKNCANVPPDLPSNLRSVIHALRAVHAI